MEEEKQQQQTYIPTQSQLTAGASGSSPTYSTLFENYRHTQQTWLLSSTEGEEEKYKHWVKLAEAIKQFKSADTFPMHHRIGDPCFYQATKSRWK